MVQVRITKSWRQHQEGTVKECTEGVADLLCSVLKIGTLAKAEKPKKAKEKASVATGEATCEQL